jgi:hypothetical protein
MITRPDLQSSFFTNEKLASGGFNTYYRWNLNVNEERAYFDFTKQLDLATYRSKVKITYVLPYKTHAKIEHGDFYCYVTNGSGYIDNAIKAMVYTGIIDVFDVSMKLTVREIRRILFETEKFTVIGEDERSNEESRYFLYIKENQGELFNVISKENHLLIWQ